MSVIRVEKTSNYTVMSNVHLRDKRLSYKTRGLLSTILSLPDTWDYSVKGLATLSRDGMDSVKSGLRELEETGYLIRTRERDESGRLGKMIYTIYECPQTPAQDPMINHPTQGEPTVENPAQVYPMKVNPNQLNKEETSTEETTVLNEPIKEGSNSCLLTSRAREKNLEALVRFIVDRIGRTLDSVELQVLRRLIEQGTDTRLIKLAVEDNLFRGDRYNMRHVQSTLEDWRSKGISDPVTARNYMLDNHVRNLNQAASEIAYQSFDDSVADRIIGKNDAADLQGLRDYLIELYENQRYDALIHMVKTTYHKDILDYLPEEMVNFIEFRKGECHETGRSKYDSPQNVEGYR